MKEYIELAKPIVGTSLKINLRLCHDKSMIQKHQVYGSITKQEKKGTYTIFMYMNAQRSFPTDKPCVYRKYTPVELLCTLAHELAHIKHWEHTCDHKMLECHLTTLFMQKLKASGFVSEEKDKKWKI